MEKDLPIFVCEITDALDGISTVSLVPSPATKKNFVYFGEQRVFERFSVQDEDEHIISGVLMVPNQKIYRRDPDGSEYYVVFPEETIALMAEKLLSDQSQNKVSLSHNGELIDGVHLFEIFITDSSKGISPTYIDAPDGSLVLSYKVRNDEVWKAVKEKEFLGFSLEGIFEMKRDSEETDLRDIIKSLNKLKNIK